MVAAIACGRQLTCALTSVCARIQRRRFCSDFGGQKVHVCVCAMHVDRGADSEERCVRITRLRIASVDRARFKRKNALRSL